MLAGLQSTAQQLDDTNKVLLGEASTVLETLWNGHLEMVKTLKLMDKRIRKLEGHDVEDGEEENDGTGGVPELEDQEGEGPVHRGQEESEPGENEEESGTERDEEGAEEGGV
jgi:hypothetical protein